MRPLSISERAAASVKPPPSSSSDRRGSRPLRTPQYDQTFGRRARERSQTPRQIAIFRNGKRLRDIAKLITARRRSNFLEHCKRENISKLVAVIAHHCPLSVSLENWLPSWVQQHFQCPTEYLLEAAKLPRRSYTGDEIAEELGVTFEERQRLKLWSFGACDISAKERRNRVKADKKRRDRERAAQRRRRAGAKPHAQSLSREKPWVAEGISRKTWYKRRKQPKRVGSVSRS
jgi:hypothetical protein